MFSNLSKAIQASRDAIGTIQTTLKDQNVLDPLTARLRPSTPQQSSYQIDEDGFSDQTLVAPNTSETGDLIRFSSDRGTRQPATDNVQVKSDAPVPPTDTAVFAPSTQQALSSMTPEQVFAMDPAEMTERLARLRRFESKFADLAKAYKGLQRKTQQIESIIYAHSPIQKISTTTDLEALDTYMRSIREKQEVSTAEIGRLSRQVSEIKEVQQAESITMADMLSSLQSKLLQREEEINRLKTSMLKRETPPSSPIPDRPSTPIAPSMSHDNLSTTQPSESSVSLKLKLRELTSALAKANEERDDANTRCNELREALENCHSEREPSPHSREVNGTSGGDSGQPTESDEADERLLEDVTRIEHRDNSDGRAVAEVELQQECERLRTSLDQAEANREIAEQEMTALKKSHELLEQTAEERQHHLDAVTEELRKAESLLLSKQELIDNLSKNSDSQTKQLTEAGENAKKLEVENNEACQALAEAKRQLESLEEQVTKLKQQANEAVQSLEQVRADLDTERKLRAEDSSRYTELELALRDKTSALETKNERIQSVEHELQKIQSQVEDAKREKAAASEAYQSTKKRVQELDAIISEREADKEQLHGLMKAMREKLQAKIGELEGEKSRLRDELTRARRRSSDGSDESSAENSAEMNALQDELEARNGQLASMEENIRVLKKQNEDMEETAADSRRQCTDLNVLLNHALEELRTTNQARDQDCEKLSKDLGQLNQEAENLRIDRDRRERELQALQSSLDAANALRDQVEREADVLRKRVQDLEQLPDRISALESEKADLLAQLSALDEQLAATKGQVAESENQYSEYKQAFESQLESWSAQQKSMEVQIKDLEVALKTAREKESTESLDEARAEALKLKEVLESAQRDLDEKTSTLQRLQEELAGARERLAGNDSSMLSFQEELTAAHDEAKAATEKVNEVTALLTAKTSEVENLTRQNTDLRMKLSEMQAAADKITASEARAEELDRDMRLLTNVRRQLEQAKADTEQRLHDMEESLALAKQTIHERDEAVHEKEAQIASVRGQLKEEEEKKAKSIQLLRQSKAKILKLEAELHSKEEALTKAQDELQQLAEVREREGKEKESQMANVTRQIEDMQVRMRRQQEAAADLERRRQEFMAEKDDVQKRLDELKNLEASVRAERDQAREELEMRTAEVESLRSLLETRDAQLSAELGRWAGVEERLANMEHELETSKRLFQTKSAENDQLRMKVSDLEAQVYEASQASGKYEGDMDALKRDMRDAKRETAEKVKEMKRLEKDLEAAKENAKDAQGEIEKLLAAKDQGRAEYENVLQQIRDAADREAALQEKLEQQKSRVEELAAELTSLREENQQAIYNRDKMLEDMRVREGQLKNLNKTLKDEVRKLARTASASSGLGITPTSTGISSPPPISRPPSTGSLGPRHSHHGSVSSIGSDEGGAARRDSNATPLFPPRKSSHAQSNARTSIESADSRSTGTGSQLPDPNPEYLKAVFLKFLEAKDKRGQLIQVLGMLLRFSPEELKRVQKVI